MNTCGKTHSDAVNQKSPSDLISEFLNKESKTKREQQLEQSDIKMNTLKSL